MPESSKTVQYYIDLLDNFAPKEYETAEHAIKSVVTSFLGFFLMGLMTGTPDQFRQLKEKFSQFFRENQIDMQQEYPNLAKALDKGIRN